MRNNKQNDMEKNNNVNKEGLLNIPADLCDSDLLCYLYPSKFEHTEEKKAAEILHKVCFASLTGFTPIQTIEELHLTEEERSVIIKNDWPNSSNFEVRARCNDVLSLYQKDKRESKVKASESYLEAFKEFDKIDFLYRSISVRNFKVVNTDEFLKDVISAITENFKYPFWIQEIVKALKNSFTVDKLIELADYVEIEKNKTRERSKYSEEREYIRAQKHLDAINELQYHKELALSYENEADVIADNKEPNTIYPTLKDTYQKAYNQIFRIREKEKPIYERIKKKLLDENSIFVDALSEFGFKTKIGPPLDFAASVENFIANINISNFRETIYLMLTIPCVSKNEIDAYQNTTRKAGFFVSGLGHSRLNDKGFTIGSADPELALRTEAHRYFRAHRLYTIHSYIMFHLWCKIRTEEIELYDFLKSNKPSYIDEDNLVFWTKGILAGLNNDFITASSILTPQLEHTLHNIAESIDGNITTLEKKRQLSPTLGSILPRLKNVFDEEVFFEINSFLQGEIDENFRNNLLHGLFRPDEVDKQGRYLWWKCLKIYFMKLNDAICDHINNPNSSCDNE